MRRTILTTLAILVLASVAGADQESPQTAVQPLRWAEVYNYSLTGATDTTYAITTDGLDLLTFIVWQLDNTCSVTVYNSGNISAPSTPLGIPSECTLSLSVDDPDSVKVQHVGTGSVTWSMLGDKR